jgi:hypothetical protein
VSLFLVYPGAFNTPLSPPLVLEAGSSTKFESLPLFNIVGPTLGLTRNLGARHNRRKMLFTILKKSFATILNYK